MSWNYSGDPSKSPLDNTRFILGDTDSEDPQLQDEEINFALSIKSNEVNLAAIECCKAILAKVARQADFKIGPEQLKASQRFTHFTDLLNMLQKEQSQIGAPTMEFPESDYAFSVGMNDNHTMH